ncbi:MAG: phosphoglycerate kinase [Syntrophomonadaceae bacterium]|nr:phosphoglycerate kinase [Syntrophomonadaceae bacterium]
MRKLQDLEVNGKRVLVRVDFNIPIEDGRISDDYRIVTALPTIRYLLERQARVILMRHLGRPNGKVVEKLRLEPVAARLAELLEQPVNYVRDCIGPEVEQAAASLQNGQVLLLENLRFHPEEEKNNEDFARKLARLADCYINDAFSAAHRAHASTHAIAQLLPSAAGLLMEKEISALSQLETNPRHPFVVVLGGAKVSDKIGVINNLVNKADYLLIGGGMAFTFLKAQGIEIGRSLVEPERIEYAKELLIKAGDKIKLPVDVVVAEALKTGSAQKVVSCREIPADQMGLDIGPETIALFSQLISTARTVFWNGPLGAFEIPDFSRGTISIREAIAQNSGTTVIGGGDTANAVQECLDRFTHVSTGGGASLEFLEGRILPGVAVLTS